MPIPAHYRLEAKHNVPLRELRVLLAHNYYQQAGGEDVVFSVDKDLLQQHGHSVVEHVVSNDSIGNRVSTARAAAGAIWSQSSYLTLRQLIRKNGINLLHVYNSFPLISPSAYYAAAAEGIPVVQTVQNYRLVCPSAVLTRDGVPCELCVGTTLALPSIRHKCYKGSRAASAVVAATVGVHRAAGTWKDLVSQYIVPTEFLRAKLIQGGLPPDRIAVRANTIALDPGVGPHDGGYALFVGRLSSEKGIDTLLRAWAQGQLSMPLKIVGTGPLACRSADSPPNVEWLGPRSRAEVIGAMKRATVLIFPSTWYEGQPLVLIEALATGLPILASDLGAMHEMFTTSSAAKLFSPGSAAELIELVKWSEKSSDSLRAMTVAARGEFEIQYSADLAYRRLMSIYDAALNPANLQRTHERLSESLK